ncbi:hypothetical protein KOI40_18180 [Aestuariicella sp. G3-2]|uniref:hypothetical protein n=1 Tax=Pseudomaricurvus albidus TaxID=2842452 RepID=UPI001C0D239E|nr:hypothetical protein [Aestuariicella albida]MBU3071759.1 hypothetical protein [Aestuariicella albida]
MNNWDSSDSKLFSWGYELSYCENFSIENNDFSYAGVPGDLSPLRQKIIFSSEIEDETRVIVFDSALENHPNKDEIYGFSGSEKPELENHHGQAYFVTELATYTNLRYIEEKDGYYHFKLPFDHPGHEHFKGGSGAPIVDTELRSVALVCRGDIDTNSIYAIPLSRFKVLLDIEAGAIQEVPA